MNQTQKDVMVRIEESYIAASPPCSELVRLSIPGRVYTQAHPDSVAEVITDLDREREEVPGMRVISVPSILPLWTCKYEPLDGNKGMIGQEER
jgi:tryptophanase